MTQTEMENTIILLIKEVSALKEFNDSIYEKLSDMNTEIINLSGEIESIKESQNLVDQQIEESAINYSTVSEGLRRIDQLERVVNSIDRGILLCN